MILLCSRVVEIQFILDYLLESNYYPSLQAMEGRWMPVEVTYHKNFESAKKAFLWYHRLYIPRAICILALVALPFFEVIVVLSLSYDIYTSE